MKKYLIKDLPKGPVVITKEQLLEIPQDGGGGTTGDYIPLSGTEEGKPVTGDISISENVYLLFRGGRGDNTSLSKQGDGLEISSNGVSITINSAGIRTVAAGDNLSTEMQLSSSIDENGSNVIGYVPMCFIDGLEASVGFFSNEDLSLNYPTDSRLDGIFPQIRYVKKMINDFAVLNSLIPLP